MFQRQLIVIRALTDEAAALASLTYIAGASKRCSALRQTIILPALIRRQHAHNADIEPERFQAGGDCPQQGLQPQALRDLVMSAQRPLARIASFRI